MKTQLLLASSCAALFLGAGAPSVWAQDSAQATPQAVPAKATKSTTAKPHKVWTDDDVATVRTAADKYADEKQNTADATSTPAKDTKAAGPTAAPKTPLALSNPKSVEEADLMIAWEDRDFDAQTEFVDKLRTEIRDVAPEDQERLQKELAKRVGVIEEIKRERAALVAQKRELIQKKKQEKQAADGEAGKGTPPSM